MRTPAGMAYMTEEQARAILLVRAWETAPVGSLAWHEDDRTQATRAAARAEGEAADETRFISRRAEIALQRIGARTPAVPRLLRRLQWRAWLPWAVALAALLSGLLTDTLGSAYRINLLAPPLLALMLWNLAAYGGLALRGLLATRPGPLLRLAAQALALPWRRGLRRQLETSVEASAPASAGAGVHKSAETGMRDALRRFAGDFADATASLQTHRLSFTLHLSAIGFVIGALAGMYLRGLVFAYQAGWESTFLDAGQVRAILGFILGPAAALTGIALPDAAALQAMRLPGPGADAAPWIHLYAVTAALVVLLPRAVLALRARQMQRSLAARVALPLDTPYFAALVRARHRRPGRLTVLPWGQPPAAPIARALQEIADRLEAPGSTVTVLAPIAYGDEAQAGGSLADTGEATWLIALLPATATPEAEIHGAFVDALATATPRGATLLALVDESAFVERFGTGPAAVQRRSERQRAWRELLAEHRCRPIFADLANDDAEQVTQSIRDSAILPR